jgi:uncharacterized protein YggE
MPNTRRARMAFGLVLASGLATTSVACDSPPQHGSDAPRQVTVVGSGHVQGVPDTLTADVGIEFVAPDLTAAMDQTNTRQQAVIDALAGAGVDHKDINTTDVTLQPQFDSATNKITGYRADNAIQVKIHPTGSASRVLAVIVGTGGPATRINSVSYSIADDSQLVKDARARAFQDAKDRAEQYAGLSGLGLGKIISISETSGGTPSAPAPMRGAMPSAVPLEPGQQTVSFSVIAVWELR